ncbi:Lrp/AsnC family transcriptional regulator [Streptomyces sp. NBC_00280]|uniref:Lrp/AsnC family transcriptional regulator n=1 Tax=Streptomyces sp. NBC_00280 TaxID=2975699 RepID=UPI00352D5C13
MQSPSPDALDLKLLHALQVDGRAPFSRIAETLGVSDQTVARRFRELRTTAGLRIVGMTDESLLGRQSWIVRLRCTPDVAEQLANALARRPDTSHVDLISGGTEVLCAMGARSRQDRDEMLFDRLQRTPQVISVSAHCLLHTFYGGPLGWLDKTQALEPDQEAALRLPYSEPVAAPITLEGADEALLAVLRRDGRATFSCRPAPASRSPLSSGAWSVCAPRASSTSKCSMTASPSDTASARCSGSPSPLRTRRRRTEAGRTPRGPLRRATTGQATVVATVATSSTSELHTYLSEKTGGLDGVQAVETALTLRYVEQLTYEPSR